MPRGRFIVLEGPDRAGKSSQARRLARALRPRRPLLVREPGGTDLGERIRAILLHRDMCVESEVLLYMASRAQLVREKIVPALSDGRWVVCDRFLYSSVAYQGAAGVPARAIWDVGRLAVDGAQPDLVIFLDVDPAVAFKRGSKKRDRIERRAMAYHRRVRAGFLTAAHRLGRRAVVLDASRSPSAVAADVRDTVERRLR